MATTTISRRIPWRMHLPESVSALSEPDFRTVWIGQAISQTGTWMQLIAQGLLVLTLWNSALALGALNFANAAPGLVVMLFGGVLADRADKRRILLVTQVAMGLIALTLAILIIIDQVQYWMLIIAAIALGVAFGYDQPAYQAFLPELVPPEKIGQVVALNSSTFHGTRMVGPAIAGVIIRVFGLATAYFLNAASFLAVIASLVVVRNRPVAPRPARTVSSMEGLREGLRHARERPNLRALLLLTALNTAFILPIVAVLTPFYVKNVLHQGAGVLGLLWATSGIGAMSGAFILIWFGHRWRAERIWFAAVAAPVGLIAMAWTREPAVAIAILPLVSFCFSSQLGLVQTMIQETTPAEFRGRVMSLHAIAFSSTMPLAALAASGLAVLIGLPAVMTLWGVMYALTVGMVLRFAGGGIESVTAASRLEFEAMTARQPPGAVFTSGRD